MKAVLYIDTSNNKEVTVGVKMEEMEDIQTRTIDHRQAQVVLPTIQQLLKKHAIVLKDIIAIEVNSGPGSFTGLRVGIAIANALGFLLNIPVNGNKVGEIVEPVYQ